MKKENKTKEKRRLTIWDLGVRVFGGSMMKIVGAWGGGFFLFSKIMRVFAKEIFF